MNITLYRYQITGARWGESITRDEVSDAGGSMAILALQGEDEHKYGITFTDTDDESTMFGIFVQEFPKQLTHYDTDTKEESTVDEVDSDEYVFVIFPKEYTIYFQAKRSRDLPPQDEIINRFVAICMLANTSNSLFFSGLDSTNDEVNRDKIVSIFYDEADSVTELEFEDFDVSQIERLEQERGRLQTYFNPIEEFQPAAKEAAIRLAQHTEKATLKAKPGESFKKDPVARIMLEGSKKPTKITYTKDNEVITASSVTRSKETIGVSLDLLEDQDSDEIARIIRLLKGEQEITHGGRRINSVNDDQATLL